MSGPDPAVAAVRSAVAAGLADLPDGGLVLVCCSGGADSLALAAAAAFLAGAAHRTHAGRRLRAGALVVDHRWHPGSAAVAERAATACRDLGLDPVEVLVAGDGAGDRSSGPEADARRVRYALLDAAADRLGAAALLLGHTRDDQAETVLLGLARGSGGRSLAGMPVRRGVYRRPLLGLTRVQTRRAALAQGLPVWDDPANTDPGYTRVRVRRAMQTLTDALGPGLPGALARTGELLAEDADALDHLAEELLAAARIEDPPGEPGRLDTAVLAAAPAALRRRALLRAARQAGASSGSVSRTHVLALDALVTDWRGQGPVHLPGRVIARRACGRLALDRADRLPGADPEERRASP